MPAWPSKEQSERERPQSTKATMSLRLVGIGGRARLVVVAWGWLLSSLVYLPSGAVLAQACPGLQAPSVRYEDATRDSGIRFVHVNGVSPERYMPETMSGGGLFLDYDRDGWIDIFLVDGGSLADPDVARATRSVLYHNLGNGRFVDATDRAGIGNHPYGMGACAADFDNDGWVDLYQTSFGANSLYRNNGDGSYTDVTLQAGVGAPGFSSSCAFGDFDRDGHLDLFVASFIDTALDNNKICDMQGGTRDYCHPNVYEAVPNVLYRNLGDGTFRDVTQAAGVHTMHGKSLGVVFADFDNDGWPDIYIANDSTPNFLYRNRGDGTFAEEGMLSGTAVNAEGASEAGMGTDLGDFDADGLLDIVVTNLDGQTNTIYRNLGDGMFADVTFETGHGTPSFRYVGWGTAYLDFDNDGRLDIVVANGAVVITQRFGLARGQRNLLFCNVGGGRFEEVGMRAGPGLRLEKISRGLAVGDVDNDGDLDLLVVNNGQAADLLRNDDGNARHSLLVATVGTESNRDGIGARLTLTAGGRTQLREIRAGSSYLGQNDLRAHFGLGEASAIERLEIRWPSGTVDILENLEANQIVTVKEGEGVVGREPFARPAAISGKVSTKADSTREFP